MCAPQALNLHSLQTPQLSGAPSFAYPGTCLPGLHKKLGNLYMGPGTQLLPVFLLGSDPSVGLRFTSSCLRVVLGQKETVSSSGVRTPDCFGQTTHIWESDLQVSWGLV